MMDRRTFICVATGSLLVTARPAKPQPTGRMYRIGVLAPASQPPGFASFADGLRALGYVEGQNLVIEGRSAGGHLERLPDLAAELVRMPVDVIAIAGPSPLRAAMNATTRIPIVMIASSVDPVGDGVVKSLARPGGNVTGLTYAESTDRLGKQLELLREAVPGLSRIAVWWDMEMSIFTRSWSAPLDAAARKLGLQILPPVQVLGRDDVDGAFTAMQQQRADAVLVAIGGPTNDYRPQVATAALRHRLPTVAAFKSFTESGGLLSYGPDFPAIYRRAASYVDRILKGTPPGDLPIELPTKYELAINLKTAKALGLTIPQSLLLRADEVIQ
jgi:putative ABC transport system substrate-binding protein